MVGREAALDPKGDSRRFEIDCTAVFAKSGESDVGLVGWSAYVPNWNEMDIAADFGCYSPGCCGGVGVASCVQNERRKDAAKGDCGEIFSSNEMKGWNGGR